MTAGDTLAIFDFDKTLVSGDSFRLFGSLGSPGPVQRSWLLGLAVMVRARLLSNTRYKELVLDRIWIGRDAEQRSTLLARLHQELESLSVEAVTSAVQAHLAHGDRVVVLTASPTFYVDPFMKRISPDIEVHGSSVDESQGIRVSNLYGEAKAAVAAGLIADAAPDSTHVYTDHRHDLALMRLADRVTLVDPDRATVVAADRAGIAFEVLMP